MFYDIYLYTLCYYICCLLGACMRCTRLCPLKPGVTPLPCPRRCRRSCRSGRGDAAQEERRRGRGGTGPARQAEGGRGGGRLLHLFRQGQPRRLRSEVGAPCRALSSISVDCCTTSRRVGGFSEALCPLPRTCCLRNCTLDFLSLFVAGLTDSRLTPPARLGAGITDREDWGGRRRHGRGVGRSMEGRPKMEGRRGRRMTVRFAGENHGKGRSKGRGSRRQERARRRAERAPCGIVDDYIGLL
jgi:hypothetical protein